LAVAVGSTFPIKLWDYRARAGSIEYREEHGSELLPLQGEGGPAPVKRAGTEGVAKAGSSGVVIYKGTSETLAPAWGRKG